MEPARDPACELACEPALARVIHSAYFGKRSATDPLVKGRWLDSKDAAANRLRELGSFIREQRTKSELSLRNLANRAGISNPYLSQIERGLRKPSADILQRVAEALRISAETLYVKAGILDEPVDDLAARIEADPELSARQKRLLLEVYRSLRDGDSQTGEAEPGPAAEGDDDAQPR